MPYSDLEQRRAYSREYQRTHETVRQCKQKYRNQHRIQRTLKPYGITFFQYMTLLVSQGSACAICREKPVGKRHHARLFIDHDHSTGRVRGLLCAKCNSVLGYVKDQPGRLRAAADYLERQP